MKITSSDLFKIMTIVLVGSVVGYFLGIYMLFAHSAYEIFYYALYYASCFLVYFLGSWVVTVIQEKQDAKSAVETTTTTTKTSAKQPTAAKA